MGYKNTKFCGVKQDHGLHMWVYDFGSMGTQDRVCLGYNLSITQYPDFLGKKD